MVDKKTHVQRRAALFGEVFYPAGELGKKLARGDSAEVIVSTALDNLEVLRKQTMDRVFRMDEVVATTGLSDSSIYAMMRNGAFPQSFKLNGLGSRVAAGWRQSEVLDWIRAQQNGE